jgi:S1-C subfamily serine protease
MNRSTRRGKQIGTCFFFLVLGLGQPAPAWANPNVYQAALPGTALVVSPTAEGQVEIGSGILVSTRFKWVLTVYHVVGDRQDAWVVFPRYDGRGAPVTDPKFYWSDLGRLAIPGKVIATAPRSDLAIIQLESVPAGVHGIPIAAHSPRPGEAVHLLGNSGVDEEVLWRYGKGEVRGVFTRSWTTADGLKIHCRVIENQIPGNPGDSGGPVVNDRGYLVGLMQGGIPGKNGLAYAIDVREIQALLEKAPRPWAVRPAGNVPRLPGVIPPPPYQE